MELISFSTGILVLLSLSTGYLLEAHKHKTAITLAIVSILGVILINLWVSLFSVILYLSVFVVMATIGKAIFRFRHQKQITHGIK